jgi:hypothetical protein
MGDDEKRAPGTESERADRLAKMMASQVTLEAPEKVGLRTGYKPSSTGFGVTPDQKTERVDPFVEATVVDAGHVPATFSTKWAPAAPTTEPKFSFSSTAGAKIAPASGGLFSFGTAPATQSCSPPSGVHQGQDQNTFVFGAKTTGPKAKLKTLVTPKTAAEAEVEPEPELA